MNARDANTLALEARTHTWVDRWFIRDCYPAIEAAAKVGCGRYVFTMIDPMHMTRGDYEMKLTERGTEIIRRLRELGYEVEDRLVSGYVPEIIVSWENPQPVESALTRCAPDYIIS